MRRSTHRSLILPLCLFIPTGYAAAQQGGPAAPQRTQYIDLMQRPAVAKDLYLTDFHKMELQKLSQERSTVIRTTMMELDRQESKEKRGEAYATMQQEMDRVERAAYAMLLPFQQQRIDQIANQVFFRASDSGGGLTHPKMMEVLRMTEDQVKQIRENAQKVDAKLQERLLSLDKQARQARIDARSEVLNLLTDEQRKSYEEMIGDVVDLSQPKQVAIAHPDSKSQNPRK